MMREVKSQPILESLWLLMKLAGNGQTADGLPTIMLPTDPRIQNLTEEQALWILEKYQDEFPDHFQDTFYDPEYEDWENQTLDELGEQRIVHRDGDDEDYERFD